MVGVYRKLFMLMCMLCCLLATAGAARQKTGRQKTAKQKKFVLVVDAGHGGRDHGMIYTEKKGKTYREKDLTLAYALAFGKMVERNCSDVTVVYTRKTDNYPDLDDRVRIANRNRADLFVSIHVNACERPAVRGFRAYWNDKKMGRARERSYQAAVMMTHGVAKHSFIKAKAMVEKRTRDLVVLKHTTSPAVLLELGFVTNQQDRKLLASKNGPDKFARALFDGFISYKKKYYGGVTPKAESAKTKKKAKQQEKAKDERAKVDTPKTGALVFKVQIATLSKMKNTDDKVFKGVKDIEVREDGGRWKYTVGSSEDFDAVNRLRIELSKKFSGAFVVAFRDGKQVNVNEAIKEFHDSKEQKTNNDNKNKK